MDKILKLTKISPFWSTKAEKNEREAEWILAAERPGLSIWPFSGTKTTVHATENISKSKAQRRDYLPILRTSRTTIQTKTSNLHTHVVQDSCQRSQISLCFLSWALNFRSNKKLCIISKTLRYFLLTSFDVTHIFVSYNRTRKMLNSYYKCVHN